MAGANQVIQVIDSIWYTKSIEPISLYPVNSDYVVDLHFVFCNQSATIHTSVFSIFGGMRGYIAFSVAAISFVF